MKHRNFTEFTKKCEVKFETLSIVNLCASFVEAEAMRLRWNWEARGENKSPALGGSVPTVDLWQGGTGGVPGPRWGTGWDDGGLHGAGTAASCCPGVPLVSAAGLVSAQDPPGGACSPGDRHEQCAGVSCSLSPKCEHSSDGWWALWKSCSIELAALYESNAWQMRELENLCILMAFVLKMINAVFI